MFDKKTKKQKIIFFSLLYICFILIILYKVNAYYSEKVVIGNEKYTDYHLTQDELPFNLTILIDTYNFQPYIINNSYYQNITINCNETIETDCWEIQYIENITNVTANHIVVEYGEFFNGLNLVNISKSNNDFYANISIPENINVDIYESYIETTEYINTTINEYLFRFFINYGELYQQTNVLEYTQNKNPNFIVYNADLPYTNTKTYEINTKPNEAMSIRCTNHISCSTDMKETENITIFTATLTLPNGLSLGTHKSYIYLNTSYNKSLQIQYTVDIRDTPIQQIQSEVYVEKDVENMTAEELQEFMDGLRGLAQESIKKLEAANKTQEKIVYQNVTQPYLANEETIVNKVVNKVLEIFNDKNKDTFNSLQLSNSQLSTELAATTAEKEKLKTEIEKTKINTEANIQKINETIYEKNIVMNKKNFFLILTLTMLIVGTPTIIFLIHKSMWGDLT